MCIKSAITIIEAKLHLFGIMIVYGSDGSHNFSPLISKQSYLKYVVHKCAHCGIEYNTWKVFFIIGLGSMIVHYAAVMSSTLWQAGREKKILSAE